MAQNFVGSNNVNLLEPNGQFGTRLHGGDDSASERYIFTMLNPLTRFIFPEVDDMVLTYLDDDGTIVEPDFYVPIIPFALLNGISGIGTGFSCSIAPYNPSTIIRYLKAKLTNADCSAIDFVPYYEGFAGTVRRIADQKYLVKGVYEKIAEDKIRITELPVGTWTMPYTSYLETLVDGALNAKTGKKSPPLIKDFTSVSTEVAVDFVVVFGRGQLAELEASIDDNQCNGVEKLLKLTTTVSTTNMHMFNSECKLHKYADVNEIIDDFYGVRLGLYKKRKDCLIVDMEKRLVRLSNRAKYIQETLNGTIDLRRKTSQVVNDMLVEKGYMTIDGDFKYLVKMPMDSVTEENVASIMKEKEATETELSVLRKTSLEKMWLTELDSLEKEYTKYKAKREKIQAGDPTKKVSAAGGAKVVVKRKTTK
jgi:DNA topoisomerase-2